MELKLVYRALRRLSHWALNFYSDVHIEGQENVPADGPLIIVASHHNEILDIATLAVTMPHGRMLSFWAKSSMFKHPMMRAIMESSGAIPVYRNPNGLKSSSSGSDASTPVESNLRTRKSARAPLAENLPSGEFDDAKSRSRALFEATFRALDAGGTVGVFPEGTSYNEPCIYQVKDGAAQVALEYARWAQEHGADDAAKLRLVPVGIVYADRTRYQSGISVKYGRPINLSVFTEHFLNARNEESQRSAVQAITTEIKNCLFGLTINAPDWDILHAATTARDIIWKSSDELPASKFVMISQGIIDIFAAPNPPMALMKARRATLQYYALLHYTSLTHHTLPQPTSPSSATCTLIMSAFCLVPSLPILLVHAPAYFFSKLLTWVCAEEGADETRAQFSAVGGILGVGISYAAVGSFLAKYAQHVGFRTNSFVLWAAGTYAARVVLGRWHNSLAHFNYKQVLSLRASWIILLGLLIPRSFDLTPEAVELYSRPPPPPLNPQLRRPVSEASLRRPPPAVSPVRLIKHVLKARNAAEEALDTFIREEGGESGSLQELLP